MIKTLHVVIYLELIVLLRRSQEWLYPLSFFLIMMILFPLAFTPDPIFLEKYIPSAIWMAALLASMLSVEHMFASDMEDAYVEQMLYSKIPLSVLIMIKLIAQFMVTQIPLILLTPLIGIMFNLPFNIVMGLCCGLLLGTPVLTLVGALGAALTLGLRQQGVLLSVLILPLVIPILILGCSIVQQTQSGLATTGTLLLMSGILSLAMTALPFAITETIRISLDH